MRLVHANPWKGIRINVQKKTGCALTLPEFQAILRHSELPFKRFVIALRLCGARPAELAGLRWDQIDWTRGLAILSHHKTKKKTGKDRVLVLTPQLLKLLQIIKRQQCGPAAAELRRLLESAPNRRLPARQVSRRMRQLGFSYRSLYCARKRTSAIYRRIGGYGAESFKVYELPELPGDCQPNDTTHVFLNGTLTPWTRRTLDQHLRSLATSHRFAGRRQNLFDSASIRNRRGQVGLRSQTNLSPDGSPKFSHFGKKLRARQRRFRISARVGACCARHHIATIAVAATNRHGRVDGDDRTAIRESPNQATSAQAGGAASASTRRTNNLQAVSTRRQGNGRPARTPPHLSGSSLSRNSPSSCRRRSTRSAGNSIRPDGFTTAAANSSCAAPPFSRKGTPNGPPLNFAAAIFDYLTRAAGMADTVAAWMESEPDPENREVYFAVRLAEDFSRSFEDLARDDCDEPGLLGQLAILAGERTNWRSIARKLIRRFTSPPAILHARPPIDAEGYSTIAWN